MNEETEIQERRIPPDSCKNNFKNRTFTTEDEMDFSSYVFEGFADFSNSKFYGPYDVNFTNAVFLEGASFENVEFGKEWQRVFDGREFEFNRIEFKNIPTFEIREIIKNESKIIKSYKLGNFVNKEKLLEIIKQIQFNQKQTLCIIDSFENFQQNPQKILFKNTRFGDMDITDPTNAHRENCLKNEDKKITELSEVTKNLIYGFFRGILSPEDFRENQKTMIQAIYCRQLEKMEILQRVIGKEKVIFSNCNFFNQMDISFQETLFLNEEVFFTSTKFNNQGYVSFETSSFKNLGNINFQSVNFFNLEYVSFLYTGFNNQNFVSFKSTCFKNQSSVLFESTVFNNHGKVSFDSTNFQNQAYVSFDSTTFNNQRNVSFELAEFHNNGDISFYLTDFYNKSDISFSSTKFYNEGKISFDSTSFKNQKNVFFDSAEFYSKEKISFDSANFYNQGEVSFDSSKFNNQDQVTFFSTSFHNSDNINFYLVSFQNKGDVFFDEVKFKNHGYIFFDLAEFLNNGNIYFTNTQFNNLRGISFSSIKFHNVGSLNFFSASFTNKDHVNFSQTEFHNIGHISFELSRFFNDGDVFFDSITFKNKGSVQFKKVIWLNSRNLIFDNTLFEGFINVQFIDNFFLSKNSISFQEIRFSEEGSCQFQRCLFSGTKLVIFNACYFQHTTFEGGHTKWLFEKFKNFDDEIMEYFRHLKIVDKHDKPLFKNVFEDEIEVLWKDLTTESAKNLRFRLTNFSGSIFDGTTLSHIELNAPKWDESLGRKALAKEVALREKGKIKPDTNIDELRDLKNQYTQLKNNLEQKGDYQHASDFHYGEQEIRLERFKLIRKLERKNFKHLDGYILTTLYKLLSGYGERPLRAFLVFIGGLLFSALLLFNIENFAEPTQGKASYFKALVQLITPFSWKNGLQDNFSFTWDKFILIGSQFLLLGVQLPLMVLAIRRKFKR